MAEQSMFWATGTGTGDDDELTQAIWFRFIKALYNTDDGHCVIPLTDNELDATSTANHTVMVQTGMAITNGSPYWSDTNLIFDDQSSTPVERRIPVLGATTVHRIVSRWDTSDATVRTVLLTNTSGVTTDPALTQTANTWEEPLWSLSVTPAGAVTLTDQRQFVLAKVVQNEAILTAMLANLAVTPAKASNDILRLNTTGDGAWKHEYLTEAEYDALSAPDDDVLYIQNEG